MELPFVFFDLDRTLIDHDLAERRAVRDFHNRFRERISIPFESFLKRWRTVAERFWQQYEEGKIEYWEQKRKRVRTLLNDSKSTLSNEEIQEFLSWYLETYTEHCQLFPDVRDVLDRLRDRVEMGILTNGGGTLQRKKLTRKNIADYFGPIICSDEVGSPKPNSEIFQRACRNADRDPERIVYVGDRADLDVAPARELGMTGVLLNRPEVRSPATDVDGDVPVHSDLHEFAEFLLEE